MAVARAWHAPPDHRPFTGLRDAGSGVEPVLAEGLA